MSEEFDFEIHSEVSLAARVASWIDFPFLFVLGFPGALNLFRGAAGLVAVILITGPARGAFPSVWPGLVLVAALVLYDAIPGVPTFQELLVKRLFPLVLGKPVFGKLGGIPTALYRAMENAATEVVWQIRPEDEVMVREIALADLSLAESVLKQQFLVRRGMTPENASLLLEVSGADSSASLDDQTKKLLKEWDEVWKTKLLRFSLRGKRTFEELATKPPYPFMLLLPRFLYMAQVFVVPLLFYQLLTLWVVISVLTGSLSLLSGLQLTLTTSLLLSIMVFIHHALHVAETPLLGPADYQLISSSPAVATTPSVAKVGAEARLADLVASYEGKAIHSTGLTMTPRFIGIIRDYYARQILIPALANNALWFVFATLAGIVGMFFTGSDEMFSVYWRVGVGLSLLPLGLVAAHYFAFLVIQGFQEVVGAMIQAVAVFVTPFLIAYLTSGQAELSGQTAISATVPAVIAALATALAARLKRPTQGAIQT